MAVLADIICRGEKRSGSIDVVMVGDTRMRNLNRSFRNEDRTTDVLSFSLEDEGDEPYPYLGEIYISIPKAKKQARRASHGLDREILFLTSHGILHLLGYTHETMGKFNAMIKKQNRYLTKLYRKPC